MTRIVSAVNAMIRNSKKVTKVLLNNGGEIFFEYDGKHKWSIHKREDDTLLWFYPGPVSLSQLMAYEGEEWGGVPMITYKVSDIGTREARETFEELYILLKEKVYGIDEVLNEIIEEGADDIPF
jgi:hypothetical protein